MTDAPPLSPDACASMAELRIEIDRLDCKLLDLLRRRADYIERAVVLKSREKLPARTTDRVRQVIARVRHEALARGLDADLVEGIWTDLIEWSIAHEAKTIG